MYLYLIQKNPFGGFQFYRMYKYISERAVKSVMYNTYTIGNVSAKSSCVFAKFSNAASNFFCVQPKTYRCPDACIHVP